MKFVQGIAAVAVMAMLAGCGNSSQQGEMEFSNLQTKRGFEDLIGFTYDLTDPSLHNTDEVKGMNTKGSAFQQRLHAEYVDLAKKEQGEGERADARRFLQRAVQSGEGMKVLPEDASTRLLVPQVAATMRGHRDSLVGMLYRLDGANREPAIAAHAQAMFDCWQEELEEGDDNGIKSCRDAFMADMKKLKPTKLAGRVLLLNGEVDVKCGNNTVKLDQSGQTSQIYAGKNSPCKPSTMSQSDIDAKYSKTLAALPQGAASYILLFKTDTTDLESESVAEKDRLIQDVASRGAPEVTVVGHTDSVGSAEYNEKLSRRRAEYVRKALMEAGTMPDNISVNWQGEADLAVDTQDNVPESANRRVVVTIR